MTVVTAAGQRLVDQLRADQVDVRVDRAGRQDLPVPAMTSVDGPMTRSGGRRHGVGVAGLAQAVISAVADADVRLDDAPVVQHDRAGDDGVRRPRRTRRDALAIDSRITLAAAEHRLVAGARAVRAATQVVGDLDEQVGVGQSTRSPVVGPNSRAYRSRSMDAVMAQPPQHH